MSKNTRGAAKRDRHRDHQTGQGTGIMMWSADRNIAHGANEVGFLLPITDPLTVETFLGGGQDG